MDSAEQVPTPWSLRRPQRYFFTVGVIALMIGVIGTAISFIAAGDVGVVPVLMLLAAPALASFYIWYFNFSELARRN